MFARAHLHLPLAASCEHRLFHEVFSLSLQSWLFFPQPAAASLATNQLSPEHGLSWEVYTGIFSCGCVWLLTQALRLEFGTMDSGVDKKHATGLDGASLTILGIPNV